jgi:hypothetical protein
MVADFDPRRAGCDVTYRLSVSEAGSLERVFLPRTHK